MLTLAYDALAPIVHGRLPAPSATPENLPGRAAFEILTASLDSEAALSIEGRRVVQLELIRVWTQAMVLPSLGSLDCPDVVVIVGLPRSGTTLLHNMLTQIGKTSFPNLGLSLAPFDGGAGAEVERARDVAAQQHLWWANRASPTLGALHPMSPVWPEECLTLMQLTGLSDKFWIQHHIPTYTAWLRSQDMTVAYRAYCGMLQTLLPNAGRLVLKAPTHLAHLDALATACPRARFIWLHRDPDEVVRSFAALVTAARECFSTPQPTQSVEDASDAIAWLLERGVSGRSRHEFIDVKFDRLSAEPVLEATSVATRLGWQVCVDDRARMDQRLADLRSRSVPLRGNRATASCSSAFDCYRDLVKEIE